MVPSDIPDAYQDIMNRIDRKNDRVFALKILSWLFYAQRPLRMNELLEVLVVRENDKCLVEEYFADPRDVIDSCQSLIVHDESSDLVNFTHFTVKQFLSSNCVPSLLTHIDMAKSCLTYLNFEIFEAGPCSLRPALDERLKLLGFSQYASIYWSFYTKGAGEEAPAVVSIVVELLRSESKRNSMLQIQALSDNTWTTRYAKGRTPLHILAHCGLANLCCRWLRDAEGDFLLRFQHSVNSLAKRAINAQDQDQCTPLHLAASTGDLRTLKVLLNHGADMEIRDRMGSTALHRAASKGNADVVTALLKAGAKAFAQDTDSWTALDDAASQGQSEVVKILLEVQGNIWNPKRIKWTALHWAAEHGYYEVVELLATDNEKLELKDDKNWRPLHWAVSNGHHDVVQLLLKKGANLVSQDNEGRTPLHLAAMDDLKMLQLLQNSPLIPDNSGSTALHLASLNGKVEAVQLILFGETAPAEMDSARRTVLHYAVTPRRLDDVLSEILSPAERVKLRLDLRDGSGRSALHLAAERSHTDLCCYLLDHGADAQVQDGQLATPLHLASAKGHTDTVKVLLSVMTDISALDLSGSTALHRAASSGHTHVVQILVENCIDIQRANKRGWTALHFAAGNGYKDVVDILFKELDDCLLEDGNGVTPLEYSVLNHHVEIAEMFFAKLAVNGRLSEEQNKAIHMIAEMNGESALAE